MSEVPPITATTRVDERLVAEIWERQLFDRRALDRLGLRIIFRGVPSDAGGPDYQDVLLARGDRESMHGDVEFHVSTSGWYTHRHHLNPRYDNVVLHVVWSADRETTLTSSGRHVPTLALEGAVSAAFNPRPPLLTHPCVAAFSRLDAAGLSQRISEAGCARFAKRTDYFSAEIRASSPDQVVYTALLEACGYASNRAAFRDLADAIPFAWLAGLPTAQRLQGLLGAAGFEPASFSLPAKLSPDVWRIHRLRPANHPARRLAGMADLLERLGPRPSERLVEAVESARKPSELRRILVTSDGGHGIIGPGRADEMAASVVLPFVAGFAPELSGALSLFKVYPAPPSTRWTRLMQSILRQAGHELSVRRAPEHQGLHAQYHSFCRLEGRSGCRLCAT